MDIEITGTGNARNLFLLHENRTIWISFFDRESNLSLRTKYRMYQINGSKDLTSFLLDFEMFDAEEASMGTFTGSGQYVGQPETADFRLLIPQLFETGQGEIKSEYRHFNDLEYPDKMNAGDHLKDGKNRTELICDGNAQITELTVTDRFVIRMESLETSYAKTNCYRISSRASLVISGKEDTEWFDMTEWFAPELGILRLETAIWAMEIAYYGESPGLT